MNDKAEEAYMLGKEYITLPGERTQVPAGAHKIKTEDAKG